MSLELDLQRYRPLSQILCLDQFDRGNCGWLDLRANFVKPGFQPNSDEVDMLHWGPTMLSSATFPRMGTHGALSGTYSLKLSTRPHCGPMNERPASGSMGLAIKRMAEHRQINELQLETWLTYGPEDDREGIGDLDVRAFGCFIDLQSPAGRYMPGVRFVNAVDGVAVKRWQYFKVSEGVTDEDWSYGKVGWHLRGVDSQWYGRRYADGSGDGFQWMPDGEQLIVSNESDDKINWMYLRLTLDMRRHEYTEFQFMDRVWDMRGIAPTLASPYKGITGLINPVFFVETGADRRSFLYLDSVVLSAS